MPPYAVSITMGLPFRGGTEETSNIFHYDTSFAVQTPEGLANAVATEVKKAYGTNVTFRRARVWGPTDQGQIASITRYIGDLTGTGTGTFTGGSFYPELAFYVSMYLGRNPTTMRKRFLRKWLHTGKMPSQTGTIVGDSVIGTSERTFFENWFESMKSITADGIGCDICAPNGDKLPVGTQAVCGDRLHIRQLKQ